MKISEYIKELEKVKAEIGDVEVETLNSKPARVTAESPTVAYRLILSGTAKNPQFFDESDYANYFKKYDLKYKGEAVCRV